MTNAIDDDQVEIHPATVDRFAAWALPDSTRARLRARLTATQPSPLARPSGWNPMHQHPLGNPSQRSISSAYVSHVVVSSGCTVSSAGMPTS